MDYPIKRMKEGEMKGGRMSGNGRASKGAYGPIDITLPLIYFFFSLSNFNMMRRVVRTSHTQMKSYTNYLQNCRTEENEISCSSWIS